MRTYAYKGEVDCKICTYVLNVWPHANVVEYFLCTVTAKYTKASPPARKISLFSSIIIAIILPYAINEIYIILHISLQVSETEGLAKLHWVIGQSVLEKYTSTEYYLGFQECSFKNPNVLLRILMLLISRFHKQPHYMKFKQIYFSYSNLHKKNRHSIILKEFLTQMLV